MHTRLFGFTYLHDGAAALGGAAAASLARAAARPGRAGAHEAATAASSARAATGTRVVLLDNPVRPEYARRDLASIAAERGQEPLDAAYDLLLGRARRARTR